MGRNVEIILQEIERFTPSNGSWLPLDTLLDELWTLGVSARELPILFRVFERFPEDDGAGVLRGIVHGIEASGIDYEAALRESHARRPSEMGRVMLGRLERSSKHP